MPHVISYSRDNDKSQFFQGLTDEQAIRFAQSESGLLRSYVAVWRDGHLLAHFLRGERA